MYRLYDGRDKEFEIITEDLMEIKNYLGDEYKECKDYMDVCEKLESENDGMDFYHIELLN